MPGTSYREIFIEEAKAEGERLRADVAEGLPDPGCPCDCTAEQCEKYCTRRCHVERRVLKIDLEPPIRAAILDEAKQAVCSDRNAEYGEPIDNFERWSGTCNALGYRGPDGRPLKPHDLAIISAAGKLCRAMQTPGKRDHSVDVSGYGSLIYELVTLEGDE